MAPIHRADQDAAFVKGFIILLTSKVKPFTTLLQNIALRRDEATFISYKEYYNNNNKIEKNNGNNSEDDIGEDGRKLKLTLPAERPKDSNNNTNTNATPNDDAQVRCDLGPSRFIDDEYGIALFIERNKNKNVVCYKGVLHEKNEKKDNKLSIDAYWLDIDPAYIAAKVKKGKKNIIHRSELNFIERTMAYGVGVAGAFSNSHRKDLELAVAAANAGDSNTLGMSIKILSVPEAFTFVALPSRTLYMCFFEVSMPHDTSVILKLPIIFAMINGELGIAERIYVKAREPESFFQLPSVEYIDLVGWGLLTESDSASSVHCVDDAVPKVVSERIKP
eukprot:Tbor_TRINITY_DN5189_c2_g4::TRINITY_DN5189_c2_g4_i2::g.25909::m.25909